MKITKGCLLAIPVMAVILLIALVTGFVWFRLSIDEPYHAFRSQERAIAPQFDALNDAASKTLPALPAGASEDNRWSVGITNPLYDHGRWLIISISTMKTSDELATYYRENLINAGWSKYTGLMSHDFDLYIRGTGCLKIHYLTQRLHSYEISIWYDFQSQSFSPPLPNLDYMQFAEYGETNFAVCPPK